MGNLVSEHNLNVDDRYCIVGGNNNKFSLGNSAEVVEEKSFNKNYNLNKINDLNIPCAVLPKTFSQTLKLRPTKNGDILHAGGTISGKNVNKAKENSLPNSSLEPDIKNLSSDLPYGKFKRSKTVLDVYSFSNAAAKINNNEKNDYKFEYENNLAKTKIHSKSVPDCSIIDAKDERHDTERTTATMLRDERTTVTMLRDESSKKYKKKRRAPAAPTKFVKHYERAVNAKAENQIEQNLYQKNKQQTTKKLNEINTNSLPNEFSRKETRNYPQRKILNIPNDFSNYDSLPLPNKMTAKHELDHLNETSTKNKSKCSRIPVLQKKKFYFGMNNVPSTQSHPESNEVEKDQVSDNFLKEINITPEEKYENGVKLNVRPTMPRRQFEVPVFSPAVAWQSLIGPQKLDEKSNTKYKTETKPRTTDTIHNIDSKTPPVNKNLTVVLFYNNNSNQEKSKWDAESSYSRPISETIENLAFKFLLNKQDVNTHTTTEFCLDSQREFIEDAKCTSIMDNWVLGKQNIYENQFEQLSLPSLTRNHVMYLPGQCNNISTNIKSLNSFVKSNHLKIEQS